ncbi:hypothetical protein PspS35_11410 [Pseudomonas sp. S35]|uniref:beta strand repeat-containing protein n=1 Tax=Pseudomonas sp. S35 TaxID=1573719 RepID=UPI00132E76BD|nr:beta-propeller fold lactonase family protein [Pseudomonas sp. S35]QHF44351.1 hypothetical protein PspS35_11410 [Pseudomonas sp. S35]
MTAPTLPRSPRPHTLALALEPRMMFDAAAVATAADTSAQAEAQNQAPTLSADASHATYTVGTDDANGVQVFKNASASTVESDQHFDSVQISVDSSNSKEALVIDGKTIELATEVSSATTQNGYSYSVTTSGGQTTITLSLASSTTAADTAADLKTLVDNIRYKALDTSIDSGARTITLTSVKDDGGTADGGKDTTALAVSSSISLVNDTNRAPVLADAGVPDLAQAATLKDLGTSKEIAYSSDGKHLYAAGTSGTLVTFAVDEHGNLSSEQVLKGVANLSSVSDLSLSADGKSLYVLSGNNLITLDVTSDGTLGNARSTSTSSAINIALSADSQQLYLTTQFGGMQVFNRDTATGNLTSLQTLNEGTLGGGRSRTIYSTGDYVFVVSGTSLVTLQRGSDGTLTKLSLGTLSVGITSSTATALTASKDGQFIYLSDASRGLIQSLQLRDSSDGKELVLVDSDSLTGVSSLALSSDGSRLFATSSSAGTLSVYRVGADGSLTLSGTLADVPGAATVSASPDGQSVVVGGTALNRFSDLPNYLTGTDATVASGVNLTDANLDRLNAGQGNYAGASFTLQRSGTADSADSFGLASGNGLTLSGNQLLKNGQQVGTFSQSNGVLTVSFSDQLTSAEANAVLHQVTLRNSTVADGSVISLSLLASDGALTSQALTLALLAGKNSAPTLSTSVVTPVPYDTAKTQTALFSDTAVNTGEVGQTLLSLEVNVTGVQNATHEYLIVDGSRIDLSTSANGTTTSGYSYSYVSSGDSATLHISRDSGISSTAVQTLVNGLRYVNDSSDAVSGSRTFTLGTLRDNGGSANGGADSRDLGISSTLAIAVNNAPTAAVDLSVDTRLYYFNGSLSGYSDYVSGVSLSSDGKTLLVLGTSGSNSSGTSYLRVYTRDLLTGALSLAQTFTQGTSDDPATAAIEVDGLNTMSTLTVSADGSAVYVAGSAGASANLLLFQRDASSGLLSFNSIVASQGQGTSGLDAAVSEIVLSADGKSLYTINGVNGHDASTGKSEVAMFSRDTTTGALTFIGSYVGGSAALGLNAPTGIVVSADGQSVYISNASSSMLTVLKRDTSSGVLTYVGVVNQASIAASAEAANQPSDTRYLQNLQDVVISPDDKFVYVTSGNFAFVSIFQRQADGNLSYVGSVNGYPLANSLALREMALSADGSVLYVSTYGGQSLLVFSRDTQTGQLTFVENLKGNKNYNHLAVSSDGLNIYTGTSSFIAGLDVLSAKASSTYIEQQASPFATNLSYSDVDLDALNSYLGASINVVRSGGASADDVFGLSAGNGLSLVGNQILFNGDAIAEVSNNAGTLNVTFTAAVDKAQVNRVLHQLTYTNGAASEPARVDLQVTFSDASKSVSTALVLWRTEAPVDSAQLPSIGGASGALDYAGTTQESVLAGTRDSVASSDGKFVYLVSIPSEGASSVNVFSRAADGSLTFVQNLADTSIAGLAGALKVHLSGDQNSLYVIGSDANSLVVFNRDSSSGKLTLASTLAGSDGQTITAVSSQGSLVFVAGADELRVYQQDSNGQLSLLTTYTDGVAGIDGLQGVAQLLVSADGRFLFVGANGDNSIATAFAINSDASLSLINSLAGSSADSSYFIKALSLSADGKSLYALNNDTEQTLQVLAIGADGRLSLAGSVALDGSVTDIQVSADGSAVFAVGSQVQLFNRDSSGNLSLRLSVDRWENPWNISFADLTSVSLSADGKQLYISGTVNWTETLLTLDIGLPDATYTEGDSAVVLLPSGHLADAQLDAADDYKGASLTVTREGGANAADTYTFADGNGLSLLNGQIFKGGVAIARFSEANGVLSVTFVASTSAADAQNVLRQIAYSNSSQDPAGAGGKPSFAMVLNDGDGNSATVLVKVNLIGINDPAILDSTVLDPTLHEDDEFVSLFKDTTIDTIEADQKIWQVVLTLDAAKAHDLLRVAGEKIDLDTATSGTRQTPSGLSYSLSISGNVTTVTLYLMRSASDTATVIDSIGFNNSGSDLSGTRTISLTLNEYTGETGPTRTTLGETVKVSLAGPSEPNTAPTLGNSGNASYTERGDAVAIAPNAVVHDAQMDRFNNGLGNYNGATLSVTLSGATSLDKLAFTAGNGLTLNGTALQKDGVTIGELSNANGVLSIRFNDDAGAIPTTADVQNALRQITYASDSHTPAASVAISVTLSDRSLSSSVLALTLNITAINDTPVVGKDPLLSQGDLAIVQNLTQVPGLGSLTGVSLSSDGRSVYVSDGSGAIALLARDPVTGSVSFVKTLANSGLDSVKQLLVSADGNQVYALGGNSGNTLVVLQRDTITGELSVKQTLTSDDSNNYSLFNPISVQESADGKNVYLLTDNGVTILSRSNGQLSYLNNLGNDAWSAPYQHQPVALVTAGDYVFVVTDPSSDNFANTLIAYKRGADGNLSVAGFVRDTQADSAGKTVSMADPKHLAVSADGQLIYVAGANSVQVLRFNAADGSFTDLGIRASGLATVTDMALSANGELLYVSSSDASVQRYNTANQQLKLINTVGAGDAPALVNAGAIGLSADGGVVVLGSGIAVLHAEAMAPIPYEIGTAPVAFTEHLLLSDAELDAANNYQGASISVSRSPSAVADDHFGFADGNGIRLVDGQLLQGAQVLGSFVDSGGTLTLTFSAAISSAQAQAILHQLTYSNSATTTANGALVLSVVLNDGAQNSQAQQVTLQVNNPEANLPPVVSPDGYVPPSAEAGKPYQVVLPTGLFSDPQGDVLTWRVDGLPDGLQFDPASRTLSGTLDTVGTLRLTVVASDPSGASASRALVLEVKAASVIPVVAEPINTVTPVVPGQHPGWIAPTPQRGQPAADMDRALQTRFVTAPSEPPALPTWLGLGTLNGLQDHDLAGLERARLAPTLDALRPVERGALLTRFQLPDSVAGHTAATLRQADGKPLPAWIRFDSRSGQIQVESRHLAELQRLKLRLETRDSQGNRVQVPVELQVHDDGNVSVETAPTPAPEAQAQAALSEHLHASGQSGLFARSQALLRALFGGDDKNAA